ncbi:MAG: MBL fold metallo-hydrolase [Pseudomonadales bacterium]|nr:MBL fold metallo-hydrolase [Pseudomonadales bacterium]
MQLTFRGVRGSIASPGPSTVRYGGNTTCIEIRGDEGEIVILDAGTGIFPLAQDLLKELPVRCHIFISHTHWDHIQGLPFFTPLFIPGNKVTIYGAGDPVSQRGIQDVLNRQMEYAYFPIREAELNAEIDYVDLPDQHRVEIGSVSVENILMNHPAMDYGYKVSCNGKSVFFTGDHEWPTNIFEPEDEDYDEFAQEIEARRLQIVDFIRGVDALVIDTSYTRAEYPSKVGWGHGTFDTSIAVAREAGVKHCFFTHHEPTRSDDALEQAFHQALEQNAAGQVAHEPEFHLATEGKPIDIPASEGLPGALAFLDI